MRDLRRASFRRLSAQLLKWHRAARSSRLMRRADLNVTIALLISAAIMAVWVLPRTGAAHVRAFTIDYVGKPIEAVGPSKLPVFSINRAAGTRLVGFAMSGHDVLNVSLYGETNPLSQDTNTAVLLLADARLLWAVISDPNKAQVKGIIDGLIQDLRLILDEIARSNAFREKYGRTVEKIVRKASQAAMDESEVKRAIAALPVMRLFTDKEFTAKFLALLTKNGVHSFTEFMADMSSVLAGRREDIRPRKKVLDAPEIRELMADRVGEIVRSDEFAKMLAEFGGPFMTNVADDPELVDTLRDIVADPAFASQFAVIEKISIERAKLIGRLLVGLDQQDRMHPLAASILRSLLFERSKWLVAFVRPDDLILLRSINPTGVIALADRGRQ